MGINNDIGSFRHIALRNTCKEPNRAEPWCSYRCAAIGDCMLEPRHGAEYELVRQCSKQKTHTHIRRYAQALRAQQRALPDRAKSFDNFRATTEDKLLFSVLPENENRGRPERPFLPRRKKIFFCNKFRERTGRLIGSGGQRPERKSFRW